MFTQWRPLSLLQIPAVSWRLWDGKVTKDFSCQDSHNCSYYLAILLITLSTLVPSFLPYFSSFLEVCYQSGQEKREPRVPQLNHLLSPTQPHNLHAHKWSMIMWYSVSFYPLWLLDHFPCDFLIIPISNSVSPSLSLPLPCLCSVSISQEWINIKNKFNKFFF